MIQWLRFWGWALLWRFGFKRPRTVGSYARYTGRAYRSEVELVGVEIKLRLRRMCKFAKLEILREQEYFHPSVMGSPDPYEQVGSIGWKFDVK